MSFLRQTVLWCHNLESCDIAWASIWKMYLLTCTQWRLKSSCAFIQSDQSFYSRMKKLCTHDYSKCTQEDSDQTAPMCRLIWISLTHISEAQILGVSRAFLQLVERMVQNWSLGFFSLYFCILLYLNNTLSHTKGCVTSRNRLKIMIFYG